MPKQVVFSLDRKQFWFIFESSFELENSNFGVSLGQTIQNLPKIQSKKIEVNK